MFRSIAVATVSLSLLAPAVPVIGSGSMGQVPGVPPSHAALARDLDVIGPRLRTPHLPASAIIADAQLIGAGYRRLGPNLRVFGPPDYAYNRLAARRSLEWLSLAGLRYGNDPLVARALLGGYDAIGGFYGDYGAFYRPGAFVAYAAATRLTQRLILGRHLTYGFDRDLARYALAYGTMATLGGALLTPWSIPEDLPDQDAPVLPSAPVLKPVELPAVDVSRLDAAQKAAWTEARSRFRSIAASVHQARVLLNELSQRLESRRMSLNPQTAADAMRMQGFLEDAADLIREGQFELAVDSLRQADYMRTRLKGATGG